jgi:tetratricopeptide (TPR) repeat protein
MKRLKFLAIEILFLLFLGMVPGLASAQNSRRPALIRDTDISEGKEEAESSAVKEPNPALAVENINIGNFYFKRKNYTAAIQRYLEALGYDQNSISGYEALSKAYEKKGDVAKAVQSLKILMEKHPESPKTAEYRNRLAQLEKKIH